MKKIIRLVLIIFVLISMFNCVMTPEILNWYDYDSSKVPDWAMENIDSIVQFIYSDTFIKYKSDKKNYGGDYKATPNETLFRMSGDCDDQAILFVAMIWKRYHEKAEIKSVRTTKNIDHAYVKYKGKSYNFKIKIKYEHYTISFEGIDEWISCYR